MEDFISTSASEGRLSNALKMELGDDGIVALYTSRSER